MGSAYGVTPALKIDSYGEAGLLEVAASWLVPCQL
jgi:hypothetical protein